MTAKIDDEGAKYTSIEWSSSDTTKAEVTGNELMCTVLGMEKGNATIICKFINYDGTIVSKNFEISIVDNPILAEVVNVGDYINYNAGNWTETKGAPASEGGFGGYSSGTSKNVGLSSGSGWRVYTKSSNVVTIVHVGCPALYYLGTAGDAGANNLNNFCNNNFVNNNFATSARSANVNDVATYGNTISSTSVMMCGRNYWLATSSYMYHQGDSLLCVTSGGLTYVTQKEALRCSPYSYIKSRIKNNRNFN